MQQAMNEPHSAGEKELVFRLFVNGQSKTASVAQDNLRKLCDEVFPRKYELQVIDISKEPELAEKEQIVAVPTLIRVRPAPARRIIGDLSRRDLVLRFIEA
jgi:circadian clock protein KaiB